MKRKGIKTILTLCMVIVMLFGNVLTVSAEETNKTTFEINLDRYFKLTDSFDFVGETGYTSAPCKVFRAVFDDNVYIGAFERYDTESPNIEVWIVTDNESVLYETLSINVSQDNVQTQLEREIVPEDEITATMTADGKTYYYTVMNISSIGEYNTNLSVYALTPENPSIGTPQKLATMFASELSLDWCGGYKEITSDSALAEFDENLDFKNLRFKEINGTPVTHSITWDANEAYDDNTYVTIHCDIKYKPVLGALNTVYDYGWLTRFDEYPANNLSYSCLCTEPVESYFKANGIDWSSFNTQWVDTYYLQVLKYHPDNNTWTKSNEWYIDCGSQTTGMSTVYEYGTSVKNELTGEREKDKVGIGDGTSGEYVGGAIEDVFGEITEESSVTGYFEGLWKFFVNGFNALADGLGELPQMIASVVTFLPSPVITLIGISVVVCIILRIVGR